jgi:uncharacterized RDD family membrane protein YckC
MRSQLPVSAAMHTSTRPTSSPNPARAAAPTPSRWRRFACMMYEAILLFGVLFTAEYLFDTLTQSKHALALREWRQLWLFVVIGVYFIISWRLGGQTLAMKTWGIRLVDRDGSKIGPGKSLLRYVLCWPVTLTGLGFLWTLVDRDRQFPHDRLLGTRLIMTGEGHY